MGGNRVSKVKQVRNVLVVFLLSGLWHGAAWTFILWECAAPLALLDTRLALVFCCIAALFHFLVFWFFGLNRFFWAWLASFPAIVWCAGQINILAV